MAQKEVVLGHNHSRGKKEGNLKEQLTKRKQTKKSVHLTVVLHLTDLPIHLVRISFSLLSFFFSFLSFQRNKTEQSSLIEKNTLFQQGNNHGVDQGTHRDGGHLCGPQVSDNLHTNTMTIVLNTFLITPFEPLHGCFLAATTRFRA